MVKIRLARAGKRNDHYFRIVVMNHRDKNTGKALANVGFWYPKKNEKKIDMDVVNEWVEKGAQISPAVKRLLPETKKNQTKKVTTKKTSAAKKTASKKK